MLPANNPVLEVVVNNKLREMGAEVKVSDTYIKRLMVSLGYVFKAHGVRGEAKASEAERMDLQQNLAQKLRYVQHTEHIPDERVYNFDESAFRVLLVGDKGYKKSGTAAHSRRRCSQNLHSILPHALGARGLVSCSAALGRKTKASPPGLRECLC